MIDLDDIQAAIDRCAFGGDILGLSCDECQFLIDRIRKAEGDAARYRWLRERNWNDSGLCVVTAPKSSVKLGSDCPSGDRLDLMIDEAMK